MHGRSLKIAIVALVPCISAALVYAWRHVLSRDLARGNEINATDDRRATTDPEDSGAQAAKKLAKYLSGASVEGIEFRLNRDDSNPVVRLSQPAEVGSLVRSFVRALADPGLHLGKQRHQPTRAVLIRFVLRDGMDVRLDYVGGDMFWLHSAHSTWGYAINLQSVAITECFAKQIQQVVSSEQRAP